VYGQPSPPTPANSATDQILWVVFAIVGTVILYFAMKMAANRDFGGFFVFGIYLIFLLIAISAFRDANRVKTITLDEDNDEQDDDNDRPSLAEDYFKQIDWMHTHHKGRHASRWSAPEPKWRYHVISPRGAAKDFGLFVVLPATIPIFVLAYLYGANSAITVTVSVALGLVGTCIFLIVQNSRN
jgi:hypothetical protein